jgi:hypothetical protein
VKNGIGLTANPAILTMVENQSLPQKQFNVFGEGSGNKEQSFKARLRPSSHWRTILPGKLLADNQGKQQRDQGEDDQENKPARQLLSAKADSLIRKP